LAWPKDIADAIAVEQFATRYSIASS